MTHCLHCIFFHESKRYFGNGYCTEPVVQKLLGEFKLIPDDFGCNRAKEKAPGLPGADSVTQKSS